MLEIQVDLKTIYHRQNSNNNYMFGYRCTFQELRIIIFEILRRNNNSRFGRNRNFTDFT